MTAHIFQRKKFSTKDRELFHFTPAVRNKGKEKTTAALSGSFLFLCGVETKRKILRFYEIFGKIAKCGVVRIKGKFTQINVHFAFCWFVGIGEKVSAALAKSLRAALKVLREKVSPERNKPAANSRIVSEQTTQRSFLEQDSTTVPNFANRSILSCGNLVGVATPSPPFCGLRRLKNPRKIFSDFSKNTSALPPVFLLLVRGQSIKRKELKPMKRYNTPHRRWVIKTRLTEEEYAEFSERVTLCKMSQAEFIRQALIKSSIRPVITVSPVNDELLSAVGKLTAEYGKIGGNLNQIARCLNEYGAPYNALSQEVRAATAELAALKFEVLQKVGEAVGNIQTYQL